MKGAYVNIFLHDEHPEVGSGNRRFVVWEGRKWMYLYYWPKAITLRIAPQRYAELKPQKLPAYDVSLDIARAHIKTNIQFEKGSIAHAKNALAALAQDECVLPIHDAPAAPVIEVKAPAPRRASKPRAEKAGTSVRKKTKKHGRRKAA